MAFDQKKYVGEYNKSHYVCIRANLPKEYKEKVQLAVKKTGCFSVASFFKKCIDEALEDTPEV